MNIVTPYLFFDGNCHEALRFYQKILGGELTVMTYGDAQGAECPLAAKNRLIHGALKSGNLTLMASDTPDDAPEIGNNIQLALNCSSLEQIESWFKALSEGGEPLYPPHDAFWGARFGMLKDRYGFNWMLTYEFPKTKVK